MGASLRPEHPVGWAAHRGRATVEDVRVDHCRGDVAVPDEFLNRADVVLVFEQAGRERVPALTFESAQAGTVETQGQEARDVLEVLEDGPNLIARHDDGQVLGPHEVVEPGQILLQHFAIRRRARRDDDRALRGPALRTVCCVSRAPRTLSLTAGGRGGR